MRRLLTTLICAALLSGAAPTGLTPTGFTGAPAHAQQPQLPPHAFLFGSWIGGIFPASPNIPAAICFAQPTVIFTADLVMRSVMARSTYVQRVISTAQAIPTGADFRFAALAADADPFSLAGDSNGFGCPNPDTLRVERRGENQIVFPNCGEFPYPLYRCGAR